MVYHGKEALFKVFIRKWEKQFAKLPYILKYILSYPEITSKLENFEPITIDELNSSQLEWISLLSQFDNRIETSFFKDYWVPINKNGYDYFVDISSSKYSIFEVNYFFFEPYRWYKENIIKDLIDFLGEIDSWSFDINSHFKERETEKWDEIQSFFRERDELGFAGVINPDIDIEGIFVEKIESRYEIGENNISFINVHSPIVSVIPDDFEINLDYFVSSNNKYKDLNNRIKNIKAFIYLIQSVGLLSIEYYSISSPKDKLFKAEYKNSTLKIKTHDQNMISKIISKYEVFKNSNNKN